MNLAFSEVLNGKNTLFIEKIWQGIFDNDDRPSVMEKYGIFQRSYFEKFGRYWEGTSAGRHEPVLPKLHTIRTDAEDRWHMNTLIHPIINPRTPNRFQFAPTIYCKGTQKITINYVKPKFDFDPDSHVYVEIEGKSFYNTHYASMYSDPENMIKLAQNDGFDGIEEFFEYFNTDFEGKLIHFTDLKY